MKNNNKTKLVLKLPYPQRVKKKDLNHNFFEKFLEMFIKLDINIHFFEALEQMPMYKQFIKYITSKKRTLRDEPIILIEKCSAISQGRRIPIKQKDS